jgi:hypothetical protein
MATSTDPNPADQQAPVTPGRSALADLAIEFGVAADVVNAYVRHQAAYLSAPYAFVAACVELAQVSL